MFPATGRSIAFWQRPIKKKGTDPSLGTPQRLTRWTHGAPLADSPEDILGSHGGQDDLDSESLWCDVDSGGHGDVGAAAEARPDEPCESDAEERWLLLPAVSRLLQDRKYRKIIEEMHSCATPEDLDRWVEGCAAHVNRAHLDLLVNTLRGDPMSLAASLSWAIRLELERDVLGRPLNHVYPIHPLESSPFLHLPRLSSHVPSPCPARHNMPSAPPFVSSRASAYE